MEGIEADAVAEFCGLRGVPDGDFGTFAGSDGANVILQSQRMRCLARCSRQRFLGGFEAGTLCQRGWKFPALMNFGVKQFFAGRERDHPYHATDLRR